MVLHPSIAPKGAAESLNWLSESVLPEVRVRESKTVQSNLTQRLPKDPSTYFDSLIQVLKEFLASGNSGPTREEVVSRLKAIGALEKAGLR